MFASRNQVSWLGMYRHNNVHNNVGKSRPRQLPTQQQTTPYALLYHGVSLKHPVPYLFAWANELPLCSCFSTHFFPTRSFLLLADWLLLLQAKQHSPKQQSPQQSGSKLGSRATSRTFSGLMADVPACLSFSDLSNSYPADFESEYGPNHPSRELVRTARRVVVKVQCLVHICGSTCSTSRRCSPSLHRVLPFVLVLPEMGIPLVARSCSAETAQAKFAVFL